MALSRRSEALDALSGRIAARLAALGSCPLCGGRLDAGDFLAGGHDHHEPEGGAS
jgi:exonuclease SbcC